ncbi:hypothetical protein NUACC26_058420 [Scytonema sp. NUACC26]
MGTGEWGMGKKQSPFLIAPQQGGGPEFPNRQSPIPNPQNHEFSKDSTA